jgi:RimJ/RimL family protein N-acetyltransferase
MKTGVRTFQREDLPAIHHLLFSNRWDYFLDPVIDERGLAIRDEKYFMSDTAQTLVYADDANAILGFIHFEGVTNKSGDAPSFTLCVDASARGKGIGTQLLKDGIAYIFDTYPKIRRIYATTREDNLPMQKVFESLGFRQEARHKKEWENRETGEYMDAVGYAILRDEFESGNR